jgi:CheY-like chemotaxis protein
MRNSGTARRRRGSRTVEEPRKWRNSRRSHRSASWHAVGNLPHGMETVLLVGETGERGRPAAGPGGRSAPTLRTALERVGYAVVQAESGAGVIERLNGPLPDLIVVTRPPGDMDTGELCARVRADSTTQRIPIVLLADGTTRAAGSANADLVFPATVSPVEVADRLRRLF